MKASILTLDGGPERARALLARRAEPVGECLVWGGSTVSNGYGNFRMRGTNFLTHRSAYELANGPIPDGLLVRHTCDNPPCVRVDHLIVGTHGDNMDDRRERGRHASTGRTRCPKGHPYDQANTYRFPDGRRACRTCRASYGKKAAK